MWDDRNVNNGDGNKGRWPDHMLAYYKKLIKTLEIAFYYYDCLNNLRVLYLAKSCLKCIRWVWNL